MEKNLSLAEIARHFSLPESTARYYCKRFASFMPIIGEGRRKRYGQKTLEIVSTIIEHMKMGKTAALVEEELAAHYPRTMDATITVDTASTGFVPSASHYSQNVHPSQNTVDNTSILGSAQDDFPTIPLHMPVQQNVGAPSVINPLGQSVAPTAGADHGQTHMLMNILEQQSMAMQSIAKSLSVLATQKDDMQRLEDAARTAKEENVLLRDEVKVLQSLLHSSEQIHHDDLHQIRAWMSRLANSYNSKMQMDAENAQATHQGTETRNDEQED